MTEEEKKKTLKPISRSPVEQKEKEKERKDGRRESLPAPGCGLLRRRHLDQAEVGIISVLAHELGVDRDERRVAQPVA